MQDRTREYFAFIESFADVNSKLLNPVTTKSEFTKAASTIAKEIQSTMTKLQKLTLLAKRKTLFDDKPVEINELVYIIKQDIAKVNQQILQLNTYLEKQKASQNKQHSTNVINSLQTKLALTSDQFKGILQLRSENIREQKQRKEEYSFDNRDAPASTNTLILRIRDGLCL
jgi:syntaxin 5